MRKHLFEILEDNIPKGTRTRSRICLQGVFKHRTLYGFELLVRTRAENIMGATHLLGSTHVHISLCSRICVLIEIGENICSKFGDRAIETCKKGRLHMALLLC